MTDAARWERLEADGARRGPADADVLGARRQSSRWRIRFLVFLTGVLLSVAVHAGLSWTFAAQGPGAVLIANPLFDVMTGWARGGGADHRATLIEFDDQSFADLGHPAAPPPEAVARLLQVAARGGAAQIILDLDIDAGALNPQTRGRLISALREAAERAPLTLARGGGAGAVAHLAPVVAAYPDVVWAGNAAAADADGMLRRVPLGYCGPGGGPPAPSAYWIGYLRAGGAQGRPAASCPERADAAAPGVEFGPQRLIVYLGGADLSDDARIRRLSASALLGPDGDQLAAGGFEGETVIIGLRRALGGYWIETPLGPMSSSMALAHAVTGWLQAGGPLAPPPWWSQLLWGAAAAIAAYVAVNQRQLMASSRWSTARALAHPLLFEKLLFAGLLLLWALLSDALLPVGVWLTVLAGGYLAFLWYSLQAD